MGNNKKVSILVPIRNNFQEIVVFTFGIIIGLISWQLMPTGGLDMREDILPSLLHWKTPWVEGMPLFPWATLVLMPLRLFSPRLATSLINLISVIIIALVIRKYKGNMLFVIPIILSPVGKSLIFNGQTDAIILTSLLLPAGVDLVFLWKPQVLMHAFWVRLRGNFKTYLISGSSILLISFFIWGFWPKELLEFGRDHLISGFWNFSLWPYSIPTGLFLVLLSIKNMDESFGLMASPLLFPYVNVCSFLGLLIVVASKWPRIFTIIYLGWIIENFVISQYIH
jgi:hypothetical protein